MGLGPRAGEETWGRLRVEPTPPVRWAEVNGTFVDVAVVGRADGIVCCCDGAFGLVNKSLSP